VERRHRENKNYTDKIKFTER